MNLALACKKIIGKSFFDISGARHHIMGDTSHPAPKRDGTFGGLNGVRNIKGPQIVHLGLRCR